MKKTNLDLPATKRDLLKLATKEELRKTERGLRAEMRVVVERAKEEIREDISQSTSRILDTLDGFLKEIAESREERVIVDHRVFQHSERIEDHEKRIGVLEQKAAVFPS